MSKVPTQQRILSFLEDLVKILSKHEITYLSLDRAEFLGESTSFGLGCLDKGEGIMFAEYWMKSGLKQKEFPSSSAVPKETQIIETAYPATPTVLTASLKGVLDSITIK